MSGLVNIITLQPSSADTNERPVILTNQKDVGGAHVTSQQPITIQYLDVSRTLMSLRPEKQIQSSSSKVNVPGTKNSPVKPHSQVHLLSSIEKCKVCKNEPVSCVLTVIIE